MHGRSLTGAVLAAMFLGACSTGPNGVPSVQFATATAAGGAKAPGVQAAAPLSASEVYVDVGGDTLSIDSAFIVLRKLEIKGVASAGCDTVASAADDCSELVSGPYLVSLPLGAGAQRAFTVPVDTGTYSGVQYEIHRLEASNDSAFLALHPGYVGVSIRVVGHYNGTAFTYVTGLDVEQEVTFAAPIAVGNGTMPLTLFVDLSGWFRSGTGALVDPATALDGQTNASLVQDNIKLSFHAFEDANGDGHDDNAP